MQGFTVKEIEAMKAGPLIEEHTFALSTAGTFSKRFPRGRIAEVVCSSIYGVFAFADPIKRGDFENIWDADGVLSPQAPWKESGTDGAVTRSADEKYGTYAVELAHDDADLRWYQYFTVPSYWVGRTAYLMFWHKDTDALAVYCEWALTRMKSDGSASDWWDDTGASWTTETWNDIAQSATYAQKVLSWDCEGVGPYKLCFRPEGAAAKTTLLDDVGMGIAVPGAFTVPANESSWVGIANGDYRISGKVAAGTPNMLVNVH